MTEFEKITTKIKILRTWCAVNSKYGQGLCSEDCRRAVKWLDDAIALLKSQDRYIASLEEGAPLAAVYTMKERIQELETAVKTQEPVEPNECIEETKWTVCGSCGGHLISKWKYCPYCGRAIKWN